VQPTVGALRAILYPAPVTGGPTVKIVDPMDEQGYAHVSQRPGLGHDIDWDYIREHRVAG
jgi:L-alanine-DL-glutamate epimerase-like enolase superfamily enzyme